MLSFFYEPTESKNVSLEKTKKAAASGTDFILGDANHRTLAAADLGLVTVLIEFLEKLCSWFQKCLESGVPQKASHWLITSQTAEN